MVPRSLLKEWAVHTFPSASDYWTFRKNVIYSIHIFLIIFLTFMRQIG